MQQMGVQLCSCRAAEYVQKKQPFGKGMPFLSYCKKIGNEMKYEKLSIQVFVCLG